MKYLTLIFILMPLVCSGQAGGDKINRKLLGQWEIKSHYTIKKGKKVRHNIAPNRGLTYVFLENKDFIIWDTGKQMGIKGETIGKWEILDYGKKIHFYQIHDIKIDSADINYGIKDAEADFYSILLDVNNKFVVLRFDHLLEDSTSTSTYIRKK